MAEWLTPRQSKSEGSRVRVPVSAILFELGESSKGGKSVAEKGGAERKRWRMDGTNRLPEQIQTDP